MRGFGGCRCNQDVISQRPKLIQLIQTNAAQLREGGNMQRNPITQVVRDLHQTPNCLGYTQAKSPNDQDLRHFPSAVPLIVFPLAFVNVSIDCCKHSGWDLRAPSAQWAA